MVKIFGVCFAALLACAHFADLQGDAYHRPLSMFRDYEPAWIGYALFGVLLAVGLETIRTAFRIRTELHVAVYAAATILLAVVAATPSYDSVHTACALAAMFMMFVYYGVLLYVGDCFFWLVIHLLMPSILLVASRYESYGIWQKGIILYFLAATVVHQNVLSQWLPKRRRIYRRKIMIQVGRRVV